MDKILKSKLLALLDEYSSCLTKEEKNDILEHGYEGAFENKKSYCIDQMRKKYPAELLADGKFEEFIVWEAAIKYTFSKECFSLQLPNDSVIHVFKHPDPDKLTVSFKCTNKEFMLVKKISGRAITDLDWAEEDRKALEMDIIATHANGCPLDLERLLDFDAFNFTHDIVKINQHINRKTGKLTDHFIPRCSKRSN